MQHPYMYLDIRNIHAVSVDDNKGFIASGTHRIMVSEYCRQMRAKSGSGQVWLFTVRMLIHIHYNRW